MGDCCPSQIDLTLSNTGGADFTVVYNKSGDKLYFPFTSTPIQRLRFSGAAGLRAATYDDPMMGGSSGTTTARMIGKQVTVSYVASEGAEKSRILTLTGTLVQFDQSVAVVASNAGTVALKAAHIISVSGVDIGGDPILSAQLSDVGKQLVVRGTDTQLGYSVQHSVLVEPIKGVQDGSCNVRLMTHATVTNGYNWPLEVRKLTLVEHQMLEREVRSLRSFATMAAAPPSGNDDGGGAAPIQSGTSGQTGSIEVNANGLPITIGRALAPTVVTVSDLRLSVANWHLLASIDPTDTAQDSVDVPLDFVVRLNRGLNAPFLPSGPASVHLDMDPLPGDDHMAPTSLPRGFYYDAWDKKNANRMYYSLGETTMVTVEAYVTGDMRADEKHDEQKNRHTVKRVLKFANKTPYDAQCKLYIRTASYSKTMTSAVVTSSSDDSRVRMDKKFVAELGDEPDQPETQTLLVVVPPKTTSFLVILRAEYFKRGGGKDMAPY